MVGDRSELWTCCIALSGNAECSELPNWQHFSCETSLICSLALINKHERTLPFRGHQGVQLNNVVQPSSVRVPRTEVQGPQLAPATCPDI